MSRRNEGIGQRKPRRNYWGNLYEEDIYRENRVEEQNYDYSDYDPEDDNDSFYDHDGYV
ncbi:MAG: hypothetical protein SOZ58_06240 [Prevotella sp.]|nr:hypothetical protein [Prevotella sp.]